MRNQSAESTAAKEGCLSTLCEVMGNTGVLRVPQSDLAVKYSFWLSKSQILIPSRSEQVRAGPDPQKSHLKTIPSHYTSWLIQGGAPKIAKLVYNSNN